MLHTIVDLYSTKKGEISKFLSKYYNENIKIKNDLKWEKEYDSPIEIINLISNLIDNNDSYQINVWISLDDGVFVNVTSNNLDQIIRYLYERYPY